MVEELGISDEKVEVVYNGVDLEEFHIFDSKIIEDEKKRYGFFEGSRIIGFHGRLHKEKGLNVLIDAFYQISRRFDHLYLLFVGDGPERKKLEDQVSSYSLEKKVIFLGHRDDVPLFLNLLDIFVLPSVVRESFGISIIEAMACGKVVIGSNLGGIPEIIKDEVNGFLFNPGDENNLVDKLSRVLSDDNLKERIISSALIDVRQRFSSDAMIKNLERILNK